MSDSGPAETGGRAKLFVPLAVFLAIMVLGYLGFTLNDPHKLPSALLDKPFPAFSSVRLGNGEAVNRDDLLGELVLVNVWATWCPTCLAEHGELLRIRRETGLKIVGVNYKDDPEKAREWLRRYGDPYAFNVLDLDGRIGVELGVYGAPESFLVSPDGTIVYKLIGELNRRIYDAELAPLLASYGLQTAQGPDA